MYGLYIHIPFCAHACPYCDFSFEIWRGDLARRFLDALAVELERRAMESPWCKVTFDTVFLGGGTPTCLSSDRLAQLFSMIHGHIRVAPGAEITVEANPETLTDPKLAMLLDVGVTRLSIGVQSFNETTLQRLGRHHSADRAVRAIYQARQAGFRNLNIDLMFAVPGQQLSDWNDTLAQAVDLAPDHLSTYCLTIEEGTPFGRLASLGQLALPHEETQLTMYERVIDCLTEYGYRHYEISNFARSGAECRHNLIYWTGGNYLGLGPSAHSHVDGRRFANVRRLEAYLQRIEERGDATDLDEHLSAEQQAGESVLLGLRMIAGLDVRAFESRFGPDAYTSRRAAITTLTASGLLEQAGHQLRLTRKGLAMADTVCAELM